MKQSQIETLENELQREIDELNSFNDSDISGNSLSNFSELFFDQDKRAEKAIQNKKDLQGEFEFLREQEKEVDFVTLIKKEIRNIKDEWYITETVDFSENEEIRMNSPKQTQLLKKPIQVFKNNKSNTTVETAILSDISSPLKTVKNDLKVFQKLENFKSINSKSILKDNKKKRILSDETIKTKNNFSINLKINKFPKTFGIKIKNDKEKSLDQLPKKKFKKNIEPNKLEKNYFFKKIQEKKQSFVGIQAKLEQINKKTKELQIPSVLDKLEKVNFFLNLKKSK